MECGMFPSAEIHLTEVGSILAENYPDLDS